MCSNPKVGSVSDFRNLNCDQKVKPEVRVPEAFLKTENQYYKNLFKMKSLNVLLCLFNNLVILVIMMMKLQYHQEKQRARDLRWNK